MRQKGATNAVAEGASKEMRDAVMQRVRVGLTGLAAVFLLTILAASVFNMLGQDEHASAHAGNAQAIGNVEDPPKEPLAELGMAPGNAPKTPAKPIPTVSPPAPTGPGLVPVVPPPAKH